ncbi:hypothetical protein H6758_02845 [Candidatus Nomurabacteria bacterium]|nr:hypothetical protein [Candidatus Nomurabacteria bacterium]
MNRQIWLMVGLMLVGCGQDMGSGHQVDETPPGLDKAEQVYTELTGKTVGHRWPTVEEIEYRPQGPREPEHLLLEVQLDENFEYVQADNLGVVLIDMTASKVPTSAYLAFVLARDRFVHEAKRQIENWKGASPEQCWEEFQRDREKLQARGACRYFCTGGCELEQIVKDREKAVEDAGYAPWSVDAYWELHDAYVSAEIFTPLPGWFVVGEDPERTRQVMALTTEWERRCIEWQLDRGVVKSLALLSTMAKYRRWALEEFGPELRSELFKRWSERTYVSDEEMSCDPTAPHADVRFMMSWEVAYELEERQVRDWTCVNFFEREVQADVCGMPVHSSYDFMDEQVTQQNLIHLFPFEEHQDL